MKAVSLTVRGMVSCMSGYICPRCRNNMQLLIQSENRGERTRIVYLFQCVACRRSLTLEVIEVKKDTDRIIVTKSRIKVS